MKLGFAPIFELNSLFICALFCSTWRVAIVFKVFANSPLMVLTAFAVSERLSRFVVSVFEIISLCLFLRLLLLPKLEECDTEGHDKNNHRTDQLCHRKFFLVEDELVAGVGIADSKIRK